MQVKKSMSISRKLLSAMLVIMILVAAFATPVSAYNGNLTFYHGINNTYDYTYGRTVSTATEGSMQFIGIIDYETGPNAGQVIGYESSKKTNTSSHRQDIYPGAVKGSSYFYYFVDDICLHQSTAWFNFDFR